MHNMHHPLRQLDLNLLLVFDALVRHRSVTLASEELAMSASAFSHALARLRNALDDELFVRIGNEMRPTVAAETMMGPRSCIRADENQRTHSHPVVSISRLAMTSMKRPYLQARKASIGFPTST